MVVNRLTKFVHFGPLSHPYAAAKVAHLYLYYVIGTCVYFSFLVGDDASAGGSASHVLSLSPSIKWVD